MQGAHDGFFETLLFNVALVRRRIHDPDLRVKPLNLGGRASPPLALLPPAQIQNAHRQTPPRKRAMTQREKNDEKKKDGFALSWWRRPQPTGGRGEESAAKNFIMGMKLAERLVTRRSAVL